MSATLLDRVFRLGLVYTSIFTTTPSPESLGSSLTTIITNDLQGPKNPFADSALLVLEPRSFDAASQSCSALGEQLWYPELKTSSIQRNLDYLHYLEDTRKPLRFWIGTKNNNISVRTIDTNGRIFHMPREHELPVLCTQTAPFSNGESQDNQSPKWRVTVDANNEHITGFRDRLSFRFLGIRYAARPKRFEYPQLYTGNGNQVSATDYGSECVQWGRGSEDCHFLNIFTPYLPGPRSRKTSLRPVMFWIHGGGFLSGTANDQVFDGGNLASRSDMVVVAMNYRVGNFGFLALDDGHTNGNYGLADQIVALDWVRKNIHKFGGDPSRITVVGQSAGANSIRAMMASPKASGKFAGAILLSSLGGLNYGESYAKYATIDEAMQATGYALLDSADCTNATSQVDCLRAIPTDNFGPLGPLAASLVVDGTYLTSDELQLHKGPKFPFKILMGTTRDDGAAFIGYPETTEPSEYLPGIGLDVPPSTVFSLPAIGNQTLALFKMASHMVTDAYFRCIDWATAYAALQYGRTDSIYYYEFNRTYQLEDYPNLDICNPPKTASRPLGDTNQEYFKCHSGELYYLFGNLAREGQPMRDDFDLPFEQFVVDTFSSFVRAYDPNPSWTYLWARGYINTLRELTHAGKWKPATKGKITKRTLQWPSSQSTFEDASQCEYLKLPYTYYAV
ncbi:cholinesterase [Xylariaceae sp. FL0594]|nr:cholinesterase [Xylariaceae sp. FL0594]